MAGSGPAGAAMISRRDLPVLMGGTGLEAAVVRVVGFISRQPYLA
jgi:hypothetical protein